MNDGLYRVSQEGLAYARPKTLYTTDGWTLSNIACLDCSQWIVLMISQMGRSLMRTFT